MKNSTTSKWTMKTRTLVRYGRPGQAPGGVTDPIGTDPTNTTFTIVTTASHPHAPLK
jgi:hypothetical protein